MSSGEGVAASYYERHRPAEFFEVRIHQPSAELGVVGLLGLCANYEGGRWRARELVTQLFDYLPEFAFEYSELVAFGPETAIRQLRKAAELVYGTDDYRRRGEFGELLLHAVCRELYATEPAISKVFFKGALNEVVHGFDSVHVVADGDRLDLLFGEVKFYADIGQAINAVTGELADHLDGDWLRTECMLITNRLDDAWPHAQALRELIAERQTLDRIFTAIRVPVLLTYESPCLSSHSSEADPYPAHFVAELEGIHERFADHELPEHVIIDLIPVPLLDKAALLDQLHTQLARLREL